MLLRHGSLFALATSTLLPVAAAEPAGTGSIAVWPGLAPGTTGNEPGEEELERGDGIRRVTKVSQASIVVYRPAAAVNTGVAVVICPGGGYNILALEHEGTRVAEWLTSLGVTGVLLKYRVPAGQRGQANVPPLQDAQRAMSLVRSNANAWGIDPRRIGLMGFSAGGHLAAATMAGHTTRQYQALDAVDAVSCRPDFLVLVYPAYLLADGSKTGLDATVAVGREHCPTFLLHAGDDQIDPEGSVAYCLALRAAGIPAELHLYESGGHGFGMGHRENLIGRTWQDRLAEWLLKRVQP